MGGKKNFWGEVGLLGGKGTSQRGEKRTFGERRTAAGMGKSEEEVRLLGELVCWEGRVTSGGKDFWE